MALDVILSPKAAKDIESILRDVAKENPPAATRLIARLRRRCTELSEFPDRGHQMNSGVRRLVEGRYLIFYQLRRGVGGADFVLIARIIHGARQLPPSLRKR